MLTLISSLTLTFVSEKKVLPDMWSQVKQENQVNQAKLSESIRKQTLRKKSHDEKKRNTLHCTGKLPLYTSVDWLKYVILWQQCICTHLVQLLIIMMKYLLWQVYAFEEAGKYFLAVIKYIIEVSKYLKRRPSKYWPNRDQLGWLVG